MAKADTTNTATDRGIIQLGSILNIGAQWQWTRRPLLLSAWQHCPGGELLRQPPPWAVAILVSASKATKVTDAKVLIFSLPSHKSMEGNPPRVQTDHDP